MLLAGEEPTDLNGEQMRTITDPSPAGCQRTETASKVQKEGNQKNNDEELNEFFTKPKTKEK